MLLGAAAAVIAIFMLVAWLTNMSWIGWLVVGIMGSITAALLLREHPDTPRALLPG